MGKNDLKKGATFIEQVVAKLKGDDAGVLAAKIARKAISAVDSQLAALRAKEVDLENSVQDAEEALNTAKFPTEMINDAKRYISGIQSAESALETAKEDLANVVASIKYFEALVASY